MRDDRPLIRTRDDLLELIAHVLRLQLSYLSKDQSLAVADTILRTLQGCTLIDPAAQMMPAVSTTNVTVSAIYRCHWGRAEPLRSAAPDRRPMPPSPSRPRL